VVVLDDPVEVRMLIAFALIVISFLLVVEPWKARSPPSRPPPTPDGSSSVE